jgi:thioesterase domain-containing protein
VSADIESYLRRRIPIAAAMHIRVRSATANRVELAAPMVPNTNDGQMVFGGSAATVALLAAWTLLYVRERARGGDAQLLIQRSAVSYERPITGDFEAVCELTDEAPYHRFRATLDRHRRARITLRSQLLQGGERAGSFEGDFVALALPQRPVGTEGALRGDDAS